MKKPEARTPGWAIDWSMALSISIGLVLGCSSTFAVRGIWRLFLNRAGQKRRLPLPRFSLFCTRQVEGKK